MKSGLAGCLILAAAYATPALSAPNLVVNGDFETLSNPGVSSEFGDRYTSQQVTGWTTNGYNYVFLPGKADTTGGAGEYGNLQLYGPNNGGTSCTPGPCLPATSPTGGNYVAADGAFGVGAINQTVTGLTVGAGYLLTFYWAAAQQSGFSGVTTENWTVSFGSSNYQTATVTNPDKGFTPWRQERVAFVASSTSQVLSFLAAGTPSGQPPFSLLDGVSLTLAPEPATWLVMIVGIGGIVAFTRRRRTASAAA